MWKRENLCSFGEQNDLVHIIAPFVKEQLPSRLSIKWTYVFLRESSVVLNKQANYQVNFVVYTHVRRHQVIGESILMDFCVSVVLSHDNRPKNEKR